MGKMNEAERENVASLLPEIPEYERPYWDALQHGVLMIQKCPDCGHVQFPPSTVCTACLSRNIRWEPCSGKAKLWSKVRFHKGYLGPYKEVPYSVALAKLAEGSIVTARLPEEYADTPLDTPMRLEFTATADGTKVVVCVPETA